MLKLLKCCFTSTETLGLLGTGAQDGHLDFHTAPELLTHARAPCLLLLPLGRAHIVERWWQRAHTR